VPLSRTPLPPEIDHLQVHLPPRLLGEQTLQVTLGLLDAPAARQSPPLREPVDVRVDRESGSAERLNHDDARRLVSDARKLLELLERLRNAAAMALDEHSGEIPEVLRLCGGEPAAPDQMVDLVDLELRHRRRSRCACEERRGDPVDLCIGRLSRENDGDEERERIFVLERNGRKRIEAVEDLTDPSRLLALSHSVTSGRRKRWNGRFTRAAPAVLQSDSKSRSPSSTSAFMRDSISSRHCSISSGASRRGT
jgi:hypothetical protein